MIYGGVNAGGKAGGVRAGLSESYLPCRATVIPAVVKAAIEQTTPSVVQYVVTARVRNVADSAWIDLSTCSYCQVSRSTGTDRDTATITIKKPETWSAYKAGGTYESVLAPSNRALDITAGITIAGTTYSRRIFRGHVVDYTEAWGASGGTITLSLADDFDIAQRTVAATPAFTQGTIYRRLKVYADQLGITPTVDVADAVISGSSTASTTAEAIKSILPGDPVIGVRGTKALNVGVANPGRGDTGYAFTYSDNNIIVATRRASNSAAFNVVRTYGYTTPGTYAIVEVQDNTDVAKRGRVVYPPGLWGATWLASTYAQQSAAEFIALQLRGVIALEAAFNPFLECGQRVRVSSTKASIADSYGKITGLNHQYSVGRARTYIESMTLVAV
jgi:hypothetical protein